MNATALQLADIYYDVLIKYGQHTLITTGISIDVAELSINLSPVFNIKAEFSYSVLFGPFGLTFVELRFALELLCEFSTEWSGAHSVFQISKIKTRFQSVGDTFEYGESESGVGLVRNRCSCSGTAKT